DAQTYATLWHVNFGPPVTDRPTECTASRAAGISGTPVIGPGAVGQKIIYLVTALQPASGVHKSQIRALDLGTGHDIKPAADSTGNVFVTTGNGSTTFATPQNWSSSVLKMAGNLSTIRSRFTPANYAVLDRTDGDFGSGGVMLLPPLPTGSTTPFKLAVAMGK